MTHRAVLPAADRLPLRLDDGEAGYRLVRAWPRSPEHMLVEVHPEGQESATVAGQWFADPAALAEMARATPAPAHRVGPVLLQPDGADAQLPALAEALSEPGAQLIGHRPGRRAVVRVPGSRPEGDVFVKVVRKARRAEDVVRRGQLMRSLVGTEVVVPSWSGPTCPEAWCAGATWAAARSPIWGTPGRRLRPSTPGSGRVEPLRSCTPRTPSWSRTGTTTRPRSPVPTAGCAPRSRTAGSTRAPWPGRGSGCGGAGRPTGPTRAGGAAPGPARPAGAAAPGRTHRAHRR